MSPWYVLPAREDIKGDDQEIDEKKEERVGELGSDITLYAYFEVLCIKNGLQIIG